MTYKDVKRHLTPYEIHRRRKTTINHAFAAAIAPCDEFVEATVRTALTVLGQDPSSTLNCVYCDNVAETWDHVFATVKNSEFSGAGHRLGNLLPCCKPCNSQKGNKPWKSFIESSGRAREERIGRIQRYIDQFLRMDTIPNSLPEYKRYIGLRDQILQLMREADEVASLIRQKAKSCHDAIK